MYHNAIGNALKIVRAEKAAAAAREPEAKSSKDATSDVYEDLGSRAIKVAEQIFQNNGNYLALRVNGAEHKNGLPTDREFDAYPIPFYMIIETKRHLFLSLDTMVSNHNQLDGVKSTTTDPREKSREMQFWGDRLMMNTGNLAAWLFPVLIISIIAQVLLRYMGVNQAWLDDAQWWMYGFTMVVGFGYAITTHSHVRVDIFHQYYSDNKSAWTEVIGLGWFLMPFLLVMTDILFHYALASLISREGSDSPNGLHGLYLLKTSLPIMFVIITIATWTALYRFLLVITTPKFWKLLLAAFPACWFLMERVIYYGIWWLIRFNQPELNFRKIAREPILDNTTWLSLVLLIGLISFSYLSNRETRAE